MKTSKLNLFIYTLDVLGTISGQGVQKSGDSIYIQGSTPVPEVLSQALADRGNELKDVTVRFNVTKEQTKIPFRNIGQID